MVSRHQQILKLAYQTLTDTERHKLNSELSNSYGFDYVHKVLSDMGFDIGSRIDKNTYYLMRTLKDENPQQIGNCVLKGDYQRMVVVPRDVHPEPPKEITKKDKKPKIPWDAYYSPAAIHEHWEREEDEDKDDE